LHQSQLGPASAGLFLCDSGEALPGTLRDASSRATKAFYPALSMCDTKPQRETNKLAPVNLKRLRAGLHGDGGGLWLQVTPNRRGRSWVFRYSFNGRDRETGLGSLDTIGLADARAYAKQCRHLLKGTPTTPPVDPIEHRRSLHSAAKLAATKAKTFKGCAKAYITAHQGAWRNPKHAAQWPATLGSYAYPIIGDLPVDVIDTGLVVQALEPIWQKKPETASRVRGRIEAVLDGRRPPGIDRARTPRDGAVTSKTS
jgi:hypothetical protein